MNEWLQALVGVIVLVLLAAGYVATHDAPSPAIPAAAPEHRMARPADDADIPDRAATPRRAPAAAARAADDAAPAVSRSAALLTCRHCGRRCRLADGEYGDCGRWQRIGERIVSSDRERR
ncbi:MAG TPA: hypothetical protein PKM88_10010 [bacterium]|nr:hypothetical protein [bacterium]